VVTIGTVYVNNSAMGSILALTLNNGFSEFSALADPLSTYAKPTTFLSHGFKAVTMYFALSLSARGCIPDNVSTSRVIGEDL
jgi:hypothetical protein